MRSSAARATRRGPSARSEPSVRPLKRRRSNVRRRIVVRLAKRRVKRLFIGLFKYSFCFPRYQPITLKFFEVFRESPFSIIID